MLVVPVFGRWHAKSVLGGVCQFCHGCLFSPELCYDLVPPWHSSLTIFIAEVHVREGCQTAGGSLRSQSDRRVQELKR